MACAACFLGGLVIQKQLDEPELVEVERTGVMFAGKVKIETIELRDGTRWKRMLPDDQNAVSTRPTN
jgi:hypothetical protein